MYSSTDFQTKANIYNVNQYNTGNIKFPINIGGLIASVEGYSRLYMNNVYGKDLNGGKGTGVFTLNHGSSIEIENIQLENVSGSYHGGIFLNTNDEEIDSYFKVNNGTFTEFHNYYERSDSSFIYINKNVNVTLNKCEVKNFYGEETKQTSIFKGESKSLHKRNILIIENFSIQLYYTFKDIISYDSGDIILNNSQFSYLYTCLYSYYCIYYDNLDEEAKDTKIMGIGLGSNLIIKDSVFLLLSTKKGFSSTNDSYVTIINTNFYFNAFIYGIFTIDTTSEDSAGHFVINNSYFYNNYGYDGVILNIEKINSDASVIFNNSVFEENYSINYGGIVYSMSNYTNQYVYFNNCSFIENYGYIGHISFSFSKASEPYFSNIDELRKIKGAFVTNPTKLKLSSNIERISIFSGETAYIQAQFDLIDDYDNVLQMYSDEFMKNSLYYLVYYNIAVNDTYNAVVVGQSINYCVDAHCGIPFAKIVGNPGHYKLKLKLLTYGQYSKFDNDEGEIDLIIKECNETNYITQDIENSGFKS
eukprot:jgi/Orpsp1_1/1185050/evm.model.c7180000092135.1